MKKFELLKDDVMKWDGRTLYRIKACVSFDVISGDTIKAGTLGGWVEREKNLSHAGMAWIADDAIVCGIAVVCGNATVKHKAVVSGEVVIKDNVVVSGEARVGGNATVCGNTKIYGGIFINGCIGAYDETTVTTMTLSELMKFLDLENVSHVIFDNNERLLNGFHSKTFIHFGIAEFMDMVNDEEEFGRIGINKVSLSAVPERYDDGYTSDLELVMIINNDDMELLLNLKKC